ncbi:MAG: beta-aspartyl-peptidase [Proteobacteria bacterium]|nr:beta-aspartyl-peptidase [Pseudomonadota bacterium]
MLSPLPDAPATLLRHADLHAPAALGMHDMLCVGGRIAWMGCRLDDLPAALDVDVVDLEGARVVPGFIDLHAHLTGGGGEAGFRTRVPPLAPSALTRAGVTSVVGLLGTDDTARSTRELVATALALREEGIGAWAWTGGYHLPPTTLTGSVRADIAFVDPIIGVGELAISDHRSSQPTLDELLRVAADAHVAGMMTGKAGILHLHLGDGARGLAMVRDALATSELPPRVFHPTHVNRRRALFDEAVALARQGCHVDITAFPVDTKEDAWPAAEALRRYLASGASPDRVTISSDGGGCLPQFDAQGHVCAMGVGQPGALAETLRELLDGGLALADALPAFTSNAAALLRLPRKGRIAAGADADLVVLDADHRVRDVMAQGRWMVRGGYLLRRGLFESVS